MSAGKLFLRKLLIFIVTLFICSLAFALAALVILNGAVGRAVRSGKADVYSQSGPDDVSLIITVCGDNGSLLCTCTADISFNGHSVAVAPVYDFDAEHTAPGEKYIIFTSSYLSSFIDKCGGLFYNSTDMSELRDGSSGRFINGAGAVQLLASDDNGETGVDLLRSFFRHFLTEKYYPAFEACFEDIFGNCDTNVTYADWARIGPALREMSRTSISFS